VERLQFILSDSNSILYHPAPEKVLELESKANMCSRSYEHQDMYIVKIMSMRYQSSMCNR